MVKIFTNTNDKKKLLKDLLKYKLIIKWVNKIYFDILRKYINEMDFNYLNIFKAAIEDMKIVIICSLMESP